MKIKVITLPEAIERQAEINKNFGKYNIPFEYADGININDCKFIEENSTHYIVYNDIKLKINEYLFEQNTNRPWMRFGEIAAYIAHYKLWKEFQNSSDEQVIICEDDAFPQSDLSLLKTIDYSGVHFINLQTVTAHYQSKNELYREPFVSFHHPGLVLYEKYLHLLCEGLAAYLLTKDGANILCSYIENNGFVGPNDCLITKLAEAKVLKIHSPIKLEECFSLDPKTYSTSYTHTGNFKEYKKFKSTVLQIRV